MKDHSGRLGLPGQYLIVFFWSFVFCLIGQLPISALTLKESLEVGLKNSPAVLAAQAQVNVSSARVWQSRFFYLPNLSLTAAYGKNYSEPAVATPYSPDEAAKVTSYGLSAQEVLFTFGKRTTGMSIAESGQAMAQEALRLAQADTIYSISSSYYNVLRAEKGLSVVVEGLNTLEKHYRQTKVFFDAGLVLKADLLAVEAQLDNLWVAEIQARSGLELARLAFNSQIGRPLSEPVELAEADRPAPKTDGSAAAPAEPAAPAAVVPDLTELLKTAYDNRPDWRSFKLGEKIASDNIWLATAGYFPDFALTAAAGKNTIEYPSLPNKYDLSNWQIMLAASWNIFDAASAPFKVAEAKANYAVLKAQEKQVSDGVELDVTSAYLTLSAAKEKLVAARTASDVAARSLRLAQASYAAQITTSLAVLDAESAWNQAEMNYWSSIYDLELAKAKINKAVGIGIF